MRNTGPQRPVNWHTQTTCINTDKQSCDDNEEEEDEKDDDDKDKDDDDDNVYLRNTYSKSQVSQPISKSITVC